MYWLLNYLSIYLWTCKNHMKPVWTGMNLRGWKFRVGKLDLCWTWDGMMIAAADFPETMVRYSLKLLYYWHYFELLRARLLPLIVKLEMKKGWKYILGHFFVPPTSCHAKTINKNKASLILFDIEYCLHPNVRRKSIVYLRLVQYSLILGSPVPCSSDS